MKKFKVQIILVARAIKEMPVNEIRDLIFENYYKWIGFSKENSYYSMKRLKDIYICLLLAKKLIEKISDHSNVTEHYLQFIKKAKHKISKAIKNNYLSTKTQTLLI